MTGRISAGDICPFRHTHPWSNHSNPTISNQERLKISSISCNSLLSALEKGRCWIQALHLLARMSRWRLHNQVPRDGVAVERRLWMAYNSFVYSVEMHFLNLFDKFWRLPIFGTHTHIADQIWTNASVWLTISINIVLRLPGLLQCSGQCMRKVLAMAKSLTLPWRPWRPWWCDRMECVSCQQKRG